MSSVSPSETAKDRGPAHCCSADPLFFLPETLHLALWVTLPPFTLLWPLGFPLGPSKRSPRRKSERGREVRWALILWEPSLWGCCRMAIPLGSYQCPLSTASPRLPVLVSSPFLPFRPVRFPGVGCCSHGFSVSYTHEMIIKSSHSSCTFLQDLTDTLPYQSDICVLNRSDFKPFAFERICEMHLFIQLMLLKYEV